MRRPTAWTVGEYGIRPAGSPDHCFYCGQMRGAEHTADCVIRSRTVVVRFSVDMVVDIPDSWDKELIESHYNEGSWCSGNFIQMLIDLTERAGFCLCPLVQAQYLREASSEDEETCALYANELEH